MTHSVNTQVHSSEGIRAGGFRYTGRGDTARCDICTLEVSNWTHDMDPFTIHSEQSPHCVFVRSKQSSSHFQGFSYSRSLSLSDLIPERTFSDEQGPAKRQKTGSSFFEVDGIKQARHRSFSIWPHSAPFRSRMIEAGFFTCNPGDQVICIYCNLMCHKWNIETDDPCEVHKTLSPNCPFVKSMLIHCDNNLLSTSINKILPIRPIHIDYIDPQKRYASFPNRRFALVQKLVHAGFFYTGNKITCFYCNGSFEDWKSKNHPIAEHVRCFPHCNYAKELCGEELYHKIQQSMRYVSSSRNAPMDEITNNHLRLNVPDEETLINYVAARLDLPISKSLLKRKTFKFSTIKRCWENQLRFKHDDFISDCDLHIACLIYERQIKLIDKEQRKIIIPSIELPKNGRQSSWFLSLSKSNQSFADLMVSFENDLQRYENIRQTMGAKFKEEKLITKERERSLINWSCTKPSRLDLVKGGWIASNTGDYWECPHCHMTYYNWKSNDDPFLIHRYLSPLCLFILSPNSFHPNEIPIRSTDEQFTDDDITAAESRPYNGLVRSRYSSVAQISERLTSFNTFPGGCPDNVNELAIAGFYYTNCQRFIRCFYCKRIMPIRNISSQFDKYLKHHHRSGRCSYTEQLNDCDPIPSIQEASNKCVWCMTDDKRLLALPCRHFRLCDKCGKTNSTCPKCKQDINAYVTVYPA